MQVKEDAEEEEEDDFIDEEEMLNIAEKCFCVIGKELLNKGLSVRKAF
jgi:hypothetical protein